MPVFINRHTSSTTSSFSRANLLAGASLPKTSANNKNNPQNNLSIFEAVRSGDIKLLTEEINNGVDVNTLDEEGNSALLLASGFGRDDIVELLLRYGADSNLANSNGETPLHRAVYYGQKEIVELLLNNSAAVNPRCKKKPEQVFGFTPLYYAVSYNHTAIAKSLIKSGAEINILCGSKGTIPLTTAAANGNLDMVELLLQSGANMNMDSGNLSPLEAACEKGNLDVVRCLLRNGADLSYSILINCKRLTKDKHHDIYSLLKACKKDRIRLAQQNSPERQNEYRETPIVVAFRTGNIEWLKEIMKYQPYAIFSTHRDDIGIRRKKTLLYTACKYRHENIVDLLINMGVDINMCNSDGKHPLYTAALKGHDKIVKKLLQNGAKIKDFDKCIAVAVKNKHDSIVNMLEIEKKCSEWAGNPEHFAFDNLAFDVDSV